MNEKEKSMVFPKCFALENGGMVLLFTEMRSLGKSSKSLVGHVKLEMSIRHPRRDGWWAVGYASLEFREEIVQI